MTPPPTPPPPSRSGLRQFLRRRFTREGALGLYLTIGFVISAALVLSAAWVASEVFERPGPNAIDREVTMSVRDFQTPERDRAVRAITNLGDYRFLVPATLIASGLMAAKGRRASAMLFLGAVLGGWALESLMKIAFRRARPDLWPALVTEKSYSFPSGHATMCTLFFGGVVALVFRVTRRREIRTAVVLTAFFLILGVDFSRVYLGAHWLTDVVAGSALGLFWVVLCATGTEYFARRSLRPPSAVPAPAADPPR
ncbi:MAG: phosphatase PAP2 family protein [Acidobacteriota bacterium]